MLPMSVCPISKSPLLQAARAEIAPGIRKKKAIHIAFDETSWATAENIGLFMVPGRMKRKPTNTRQVKITLTHHGNSTSISKTVLFLFGIANPQYVPRASTILSAQPYFPLKGEFSHQASSREWLGMLDAHDMARNVPQKILRCRAFAGHVTNTNVITEGLILRMHRVT